MRTRTITLALLLLATPAGGNEALSEKRISLELEDTPIPAVLSMIASQNQLNLVVSGDVTGSVTMRLDDVTIAAALDAILTSNGYNYFVKDDVIIVKPTELSAAGELGCEIVTLKYLSPVTAEKALKPLLSTKGSLIVLDRASATATKTDSYHANRLLITDLPARIAEMTAVIGRLDVRERTVLIEAKIIETTVDAQSNLGIEWPDQLSAKLSRRSDAASSTTTTTTTTDERETGSYDPNNGDWVWGKLSVGEVNLVLNMLEQDGNSRLVSDPRITTLENHEAEFKFTTVYPIQTINRFTEGAATSDIVTFQDEEVGISLVVTPRINEGGRITLDVEPTVEDIIDYNGPPGNRKPVTASRSIRTRITVNDGETVALGGLLKEVKLETVNRVPLLGHIPLLGSILFSNKSVETASTDLLILITPHVLD